MSIADPSHQICRSERDAIVKSCETTTIFTLLEHPFRFLRSVAEAFHKPRLYGTG